MEAIRYMSIKQIEKEWGVQNRTVAEYCRKGLVYGAKKEAGKGWIIPEQSKKPLTKTQMAKVLWYFETEERQEQLKHALEKEFDTEDLNQVVQYLKELDLLDVQGTGTFALTSKAKAWLKEKQESSKQKTKRRNKFTEIIKLIRELVGLAAAVISLFARTQNVGGV